MANQKGRGTRAENAVGDELGAAGFDVIRSAASKGAADLVAVGDWGVVFVQVKLGAQGKPFKMPSPAERRELLRIVRRAGGLAVAACRIPGSGPRAARTEWRVLFGDGGPRDWYEWHPGRRADNQSIKTEFLRDQIVQESARDKLLSVLRGQAEECCCDNPNCTPPEALVDAFEAELATASSERDCLAMAVLFASQWTPQAPMSLREGIDEILATMPGAERASGPVSDTLPAWLYQRFMPHGEGWDRLDDDDRSYWEHQARAVRRAVARGGFKPAAAASAAAVAGGEQ